MGQPRRRAGEGPKRRGSDAGFDATRSARQRRRTLVGVLVALLVLPGSASATELRSGDLHYGDRGRAVVLLQRRLVKLRYLDHRRVDGIFGDMTWHAVVALQGWEQIDRDGVVGPQTRRALRRARVPQPWLRLRRALAIDLTRQVLLVVEDRAVRRAVHVSTGAAFPTPHGRFTVVRRVRESWSRPYRLWLPYALYFHRGLAIHAFPLVPGKPASHGCIRVPTEDARFVFEAAPLGTPVLIRGAWRVAGR
jgi:hypothetical protein